MTEQTTQINIPGDKLSADDFEVNAQGDVVVKNKNIAELIKNSVLKPSQSGTKPAFSVGVSVKT